MSFTRTKVTTFKERLNDLCEVSGKSDAEISDALRVSRQTVSAWRIGTRSPREPMAMMIAQYFNVSLPWLLGFDVPIEGEVNDSFTSKEIEFIKKLRVLDERGRENVEVTLDREYARAIEQEKKTAVS